MHVDNLAPLARCPQHLCWKLPNVLVLLRWARLRLLSPRQGHAQLLCWWRSGSLLLGFVRDDSSSVLRLHLWLLSRLSCLLQVQEQAPKWQNGSETKVSHHKMQFKDVHSLTRPHLFLDQLKSWNWRLSAKCWMTTQFRLTFGLQLRSLHCLCSSIVLCMPLCFPTDSIKRASKWFGQLSQDIPRDLRSLFFSCRQYRNRVVKNVHATGQMVGVIQHRLSCTAIFDFMDYLHEDLSFERRRDYRINTSIPFIIAVAGAWIAVLCWILILVINFFRYRASRNVRI